MYGSTALRTLMGLHGLADRAVVVQPHRDVHVGRAGDPPTELPRATVPTAPPTVPTPAVAAPVVADATAGAVTAAAPVAGKAGSMRFPDGSTRPALNGVTEALEIPWPSGRPWSPVVEQVHHNGVDWLRHADGSFSTTIVRTEEVSGRTVQMPLSKTFFATSFGMLTDRFGVSWMVITTEQPQ